MSTRLTADDDTATPVVGFDGDRPRGCRWDESVCTAAPEYRVVRGDHGHDHEAPDVDAYCARHYALELARLVEVHLPDCEGSAAAHVSAHGRI